MFFERGSVLQGVDNNIVKLVKFVQIQDGSQIIRFCLLDLLWCSTKTNKVLQWSVSPVKGQFILLAGDERLRQISGVL